MPLNELAREIIEGFEAEIELFADIYFERGASTLSGSGEDPVLTVTIKYDELDAECLKAIKEILMIAENGASEVIVEISDN